MLISRPTLLRYLSSSNKNIFVYFNYLSFWERLGQKSETSKNLTGNRNCKVYYSFACFGSMFIWVANHLCSKVRNYKECKVLTYLRLYKSGGLVSFWIIDISIASIRYLMCQKNGTNLVSLYCQFFSKTYLHTRNPRQLCLSRLKSRENRKWWT